MKYAFVSLLRVKYRGVSMRLCILNTATHIFTSSKLYIDSRSFVHLFFAPITHPLCPLIPSEFVLFSGCSCFFSFHCCLQRNSSIITCLTTTPTKRTRARVYGTFFLASSYCVSITFDCGKKPPMRHEKL